MDENKVAARKKFISHLIMTIILIVVFFAFIFPFLMVIVNVFKTKADITSNPLALIGAHGFTMENFPKAMDKMKFWSAFRNSLIITGCSTVLTLLFSAMASFVIVRNKWKACALMFSLMIASMVIPFQVLMIPLVSLYGGMTTFFQALFSDVKNFTQFRSQCRHSTEHTQQISDSLWRLCFWQCCRSLFCTYSCSVTS